MLENILPLSKSLPPSDGRVNTRVKHAKKIFTLFCFRGLIQEIQSLFWLIYDKSSAEMMGFGFWAVWWTRGTCLETGNCLPLHLILLNCTLTLSSKYSILAFSKRRAFRKKLTVSLHGILVVQAKSTFICNHCVYASIFSKALPPCLCATPSLSPQTIFWSEHRIILARIYASNKSVADALQRPMS